MTSAHPYGQDSMIDSRGRFGSEQGRTVTMMMAVDRHPGMA